MNMIPVKEAAEMLRIHTTHVHRLAKDGKIKSHRTTPRKTLFCVESIKAYIDENNANK
jgi:excisionase family DNA binding protein